MLWRGLFARLTIRAVLGSVETQRESKHRGRTVIPAVGPTLDGEDAISGGEAGTGRLRP